MNNKSVLVIGDVSFDVFLTPRPTETLCRKQEEESYICFTYGDKIPVDAVSYYPGGNAANVAIGLKRLGVNVSLVSSFGNDSLSGIVKKHLNDEHIDTTFSTLDTNAPCNYATVISYNDERTIFTYHAPRQYVFPTSISEYPIIYLTSMGDGFEPFYSTTINWIRAHPDVKLCFNPGSVQLHSDIEIIKELLSVTSYLFINRKEAEYFTQIDKSIGKEWQLVNALRAYGIDTIAITDGNNGSYVYSQSTLYKASCFPTTVVDKTGAGDAYNAGFLASLLQGYSISDAILIGASNSSAVIHAVGAQKKLLYEKDISLFLEKARLAVKVEHILP